MSGDRDVSGGEVWLRIHDAKPSDTGLREHSDPIEQFCVNARIPLMLGLSTLSRQAQANCHQVRAMGVCSAMQHIFNENAMQARTPASNRMAKANRASHGPRVSSHSQAKAREKKVR